MKNILLLLFISYFIISCSSNTKRHLKKKHIKCLKLKLVIRFPA